MSSKITTSIIKKWRGQGMFIRFIDGNIHNCTPENLVSVSLIDAMAHVDDWVVDWDIHLTKKEINTVKDPSWQEGLMFR